MLRLAAQLTLAVLGVLGCAHGASTPGSRQHSLASTDTTQDSSPWAAGSKIQPAGTEHEALCAALGL